MLGAPKAEGTPADIRISGRLHQQHAILVRHLRHGQMRYHIMPHPSNSKYVAVNSQVLSVGTNSIRPWSQGHNESTRAIEGESPIGCALLNDGDVIQLGTSVNNCVSLRFSQEHGPDSQKLCETAVLLLEDDSGSNESIVSSQGRLGRTAVLFYEQALFGPGPDVDVRVHADFDFTLSLEECGDKMMAACTGAVLLCDGQGGLEYDDDLLRYRTEWKVRTIPSLRESQEDFEQVPKGVSWRIKPL